MAANGGTFEVYYFKHRVTHIICSNLPNAKIKALEKERCNLCPVNKGNACWMAAIPECQSIMDGQQILEGLITANSNSVANTKLLTCIQFH